jgi:iron complex transport system substrate-binding protein
MASIGTVVALGAAALAVLGAGCGDSSSDSDGAGGDTAPRPERIVSLSPSATEALFAVGAGEQVVAVDDESDYPRSAPRTDLSSYQPNVEAIAGYRPDLIVLPDTVPPDVISGLRRLKLRVLAQAAPEELSEAYAQIRKLGAVTGHRQAGERVARRVRASVERAIASAPDGSSLKVFHELDPDLFSASSDSFIGRIYARLGLRNVADPAARKAGSPYPQLSSEAVVSANPDLVVLADSECCGQTPEKVGRRAGWSAVAAVRNEAVVAIDDDIASRWGPRIPVFVERVVRAMETARAGAVGG